MTTLYWGLCFAKVLLCYIFVLFVWPSVVFRKYLRNKSKIFRFSFCAATQVVLINTAVLLLGLVHLLNPWVVNILFYGTLLFSTRHLYMPKLSQWREFRKMVSGTLKWRQLLMKRRRHFIRWLKNLISKLWQQFRPHLLEYILLTLIAAYAVAYFGYTPFVDHSYGFGDMYTHHSWIYGLVNGQIFSAGVYPEGMHCVVYLMHTVSALPVYNCNLFLGCINMFVYVFAAYAFMREIFRWRGTPFLVLTFFLVFAVKSMDMAISMARLQRSLPGEYGLYTQFLCPLFLLKFLKEEHEEGWHKNPKAWFKNDNLIVFAMSLAASIAIHFYVTINAFFICLPFAIVFIKRVFTNGRFLPLVAAVLCGVIIAVLPMGGALLSGIPFQGSIGWALSVIEGESGDSPTAEDFENALQAARLRVIYRSPRVIVNEWALLGSPAYNQAQEEAAPRIPLRERIRGLWSTVKDKFSILYYRGYSRLLGGDQAATLMVRLSLLLAAFCLIFRLIFMLIRPLSNLAGVFDNYLPVIGASLVVMLFYAAPSLGIPELIAYIRLPSTAYILLLMVVAMVIDIPLGFLLHFSPSWLQQILATACVAAICVATIKTGNYHGYFYNELTRYRSVVNVTSSIIESFPKYSYTIVGSTDDLYSTIQYGRHEELLKFLQSAQRKQGYYLPTEYVFVYVEKQPIGHAQYHYSSGPAWLASDVYADTNVLRTRTSKYPEIFHTEINDEAAHMSVRGFPVEYGSYRDAEKSTIINSNANRWCQEFGALHDNEMKVYYEDDVFICYYFRQNTFSLYDLAIWV